MIFKALLLGPFKTIGYKMLSRVNENVLGGSLPIACLLLIIKFGYLSRTIKNKILCAKP